MIPIYQTNDYTLLQTKEKNFMGKFKPKLNKTGITHTQMETNIYTDVYIYTHKNLETHIHAYTEKNKYK